MEGAKDCMIEFQAIVVSYPLKDVYNIDKTKLFQKATLDTILATKAQLGTKKQKARLSLTNYSNADGSDKIPLWIISILLQPYYFVKARININSLNIHWRHNKKAQITTIIILKWLTQFNKRIQNKKVFLLINGFSAHQAAV